MNRIGIRDAFATALTSMVGFTLLSSNTEDIPPGQLPVVRLFFDRETVIPELHGDDGRQLEVIVSAVLKDNVDIYLALDQAAAAVEAAVSDPRMGGACMYAQLTQTQFLLDDSQPVGEVRLTYSVTY